MSCGRGGAARRAGEGLDGREEDTSLHPDAPTPPPCADLYLFPLFPPPASVTSPELSSTFPAHRSGSNFAVFVVFCFCAIK